MGKLLDLAAPSMKSMTLEEKLMAALAKHNTKHILYPPFLEREKELPTLNWVKLPFCHNSRRKVPKKKGVYAFALDFGGGNLPNSSHILYVGKGGDLKTQNNLWARYYDYIRTKRKNDRPRICEMLRQWDGHLNYYYATVDGNVSTGDVEETLLDILIPPYNRGDFSAELKTLLKGANIL
ncbi:hypothetical protein GBO14_16260 [Pseudoalteromonas shioyasakiensis]|uniref:hypothetical protein n=1 Tax=Pseudoalteromonas shioyasakiensis TaxID=1190813 RepID=UPI00209470CB|nr:hypothetical protein [Pseudoalteromonas shioyasakiensis]MCO6356274.1 hypothetical protein [Pseudoalteromonas shioyasakiensis]